MSVKTEVAELMNKDGLIYDISEKVVYKCKLTNEEKEISEIVDAWAKEIGATGKDYDHEIANYITKVINPEVYDKPDELLSTMFNRGSIGEFDDEKIDVTPINTLQAYNAAKGGNVRKSYIDVTSFTPTWKHKQVETSIKYSDLRRNGFKSVATLTTFALETLKNAQIADVFNILDSAITSSGQVFAITGSTLTKTVMDQLSLYVLDHVWNGETPFTFSLNKYAQAIANMAGYTSYMSFDMQNEFNRYGFVKEYGGMQITGISGAKKSPDGTLLVPDLRIFGVAGVIGNMDMRGDVRVYETLDNNQEKVDIKVTGYEYGVVIDRPYKVAKVTFTA